MSSPLPPPDTPPPDNVNDPLPLPPPHQPSTPAPPLRGTHAPVPDYWSSVPEIVLVRILSLLPVLDRQGAARVCRSWQQASTHPLVWQFFQYGVQQSDTTTAFGPPREISVGEEDRGNHVRYLDLIETYGHRFSRVHIVLHRPDSFEVLRKLGEVCRAVRFCVIRVHRASPLCEEKQRRGVTQFLSVNTALQEIYLKNVDFPASHDPVSSPAPFPIGHVNAGSLRKLSLVNSFRQSNLSALKELTNVTDLTLLPHQVRFSWLHQLASASLRTLNIVNMVGVWKSEFHALPEESWKRIASRCPQLRVHCYLSDLYNCSQLLSPGPGLPLATLVCREHFNMKLGDLHQLLTPYAATLTTVVYIAQGGGSGPGPEPGRQRPADEDALLLVQSLPRLKTLAIRDSLHSSTVLLMAQLCPSLRDPVVREDRIYFRFLLPRKVSVTQRVRDFTEANFGADRFVPAMCRLLRREWRPLTRKEYFGMLNASSAALGTSISFGDHPNADSPEAVLAKTTRKTLSVNLFHAWDMTAERGTVTPGVPDFWVRNCPSD
ncbi:uncharacterized protein LOC143297678 [Babylonia areolata]|uniref:uncharacterized protein LOC143297678 n=1 Tax=Babylonia areolata TaxID=304850 RepID=UPI003FD6B6BD